MVFRDDQCVGMFDHPELASEIVAALNGVAPNDREWICNALGQEANRIWGKQEKEYPSNILDIVGNNLREGKSEELTVPPDWMKRQGYGGSK
jgi:hypothetical protein